MDFIDFIFKLVLRFVPISEKDYKQMYNDAQEWKLGLKDDSENKLEAMYSRYSREWYVKLIIAVMYIPAVRWVMEFMSPTEEEETNV